MKTFHGHGYAYYICPKLIEMDERFKVHHSKWPQCRKRSSGAECLQEHEHEEPVPDGMGHSECIFRWIPGSLPPSEHPGSIPMCACGRQLVWTDLDDPEDSAHHVIVTE